jgi:hypothetical protein
MAVSLLLKDGLRPARCMLAGKLAQKRSNRGLCHFQDQG